MTNVDAIIEFDKFFGTKTTLIGFPQYINAEREIIKKLIRRDVGVEIDHDDYRRVITWLEVMNWRDENINLDTWKQVLKKDIVFRECFGEKKVQKFLKRLEDLMKGE